MDATAFTIASAQPPERLFRFGVFIKRTRSNVCNRSRLRVAFRHRLASATPPAMVAIDWIRHLREPFSQFTWMIRDCWRSCRDTGLGSGGFPRPQISVQSFGADLARCSSQAVTFRPSSSPNINVPVFWHNALGLDLSTSHAECSQSVQTRDRSNRPRSISLATKRVGVPRELSGSGGSLFGSVILVVRFVSMFGLNGFGEGFDPDLRQLAAHDRLFRSSWRTRGWH